MRLAAPVRSLSLTHPGMLTLTTARPRPSVPIYELLGSGGTHAPFFRNASNPPHPPLRLPPALIPIPNPTPLKCSLQVTLEWEDLHFGVKHMEILHGLGGEVRPGEMLAIMGSSGAGKTTLLNLLAGRLTSSRNYTSSGRVLVNGEPRCAVFRAEIGGSWSGGGLGGLGGGLGGLVGRGRVFEPRCACISFQSGVFECRGTGTRGWVG